MYASPADFVSLFSEAEWLQLTDRDLDGDPDPGVGEGALATASATVDGYVGTRYQIPLTPIDPIIRQATLDLGRWLLSGQFASERVSEGRTSAMKILTDIQAGRIQLSAALRDAATASVGVAHSTPEPSFTRPSAIPGF